MLTIPQRTYVLHLANIFAAAYTVSLLTVMNILCLESEHGKGIADGIDSAVKRVINAIIAENVNKAVRYVLLKTS